MRPFLVALCLLIAVPASAQTQKKKDHDALALVVAMSGVVLTAAGYGIILHHDTDRGGSDPAWVVGGVAVVAGGVTMTWIGLRHVSVAPQITPRSKAIVATIRWGNNRR